MQKDRKELGRFVYPFICIEFYLIFVSTTVWLKEKRKKERKGESKKRREIQVILLNQFISSC